MANILRFEFQHVWNHVQCSLRWGKAYIEAKPILRQQLETARVFMARGL